MVVSAHFSDHVLRKEPSLATIVQIPNKNKQHLLGNGGTNKDLQQCVPVKGLCIPPSFAICTFAYVKIDMVQSSVLGCHGDNQQPSFCDGGHHYLGHFLMIANKPHFHSCEMDVIIIACLLKEHIEFRL